MITILVVEDEEYARQSLIKKIKEYDVQKQFQILETTNGERGFEFYCEYLPDLVITDIRMPKMDGLELLKVIKKKNPKAQVVMLSAYSEFEYARMALKDGACDYILKPIEDEKLKECIDKSLNKSRTEKREIMMTGKDITTRYILKCIQNDGEPDFIEQNMFQKVFHKFQVLTIFLPRYQEINKEDILQNIGNILGEEMWTGFRFVETKGKVWTLVINITRENFFIPRKILRIFTDAGFEVYIGVSGEYTEPERIKEAYQEAMELLEYRIFIPGQLITGSQINKDILKSYCLSKDKETLLKDALEKKNTSKTEYILAQIFEEVREQGWIKIDYLELLLSQISIIMRRALQISGDDQLRLRESRTSVMDFSDLDEMENYFQSIGRNICKLSEKAGEESTRDVVAMMTEYAQVHFNQEITVKELAEKVLFMNPTYVSHAFVEKTGISFSAWLRGLRMDHAKKLLTSSKLSITEIASMSGYNDTSQFIRIFRQETGMTPKKYRDWIHMEESKKRKDSNKYG